MWHCQNGDNQSTSIRVVVITQIVNGVDIEREVVTIACQGGSISLGGEGVTDVILFHLEFYSKWNCCCLLAQLKNCL